MAIRRRISASWPSPDHLQTLKQAAREAKFLNSEDLKFVASPYRICPLGAHIDHQGGSVTAMALDSGVLLAFTALNLQQIKLKSMQFEGEVSFSFSDAAMVDMASPLKEKVLQETLQEAALLGSKCKWGIYALGAVYALLVRGYCLSKGICGILDGGDGFHGCGVSSSAATGIALLMALEQANGICVSVEENIELDRLIENGYLGLCNGVLDQSAILLSCRGSLTLIRCKDRTYDLYYPAAALEQRYKILLAFSGLQHSLVSKPGYNMRVAECKEAAKVLLKAVGREGEEPLLGNVSVEEYIAHKNKLDGDLAKRAKHFFTENSRVEQGIRAWAAGDLESFGRLMCASGRSSIDNYECGCEPLIDLWRILVATPGVFGGRFSGAGFRGCCVGLVATNLAEMAARSIEEKYRKQQPELSRNLPIGKAVVLLESADGAGLVLD